MPRARKSQGGRELQRRSRQGRSNTFGKKKATSTLFSSKNGFPDHARVRLSYTSTFSLTTTTASTAYKFRGNGPWDPDATGSGSQPMNWDDWAARYSRYKVYGSRVKLVAVANVATATAIDICLYPSNGDVALSIGEAQSLPRTKWGSASNGTRTWTATHAASSESILGCLHAQFEGRESVDALVSAVPADEWYWHIVQIGCDSSTSATGLYTFEIEYDVMFYDRLDGRLDLATIATRNKKAFEERKRPQPSEDAKTLRTIGFKQVSIPIKNAPSESKADSKEAPLLKKATADVSSLGGFEFLDEHSDDDEKEFLEYLRKKFKARSAVRQALAFEDADFSGSRTVGST